VSTREHKSPPEAGGHLSFSIGLTLLA